MDLVCHLFLYLFPHSSNISIGIVRNKFDHISQ